MSEMPLSMNGLCGLAADVPNAQTLSAAAEERLAEDEDEEEEEDEPK